MCDECRGRNSQSCPVCHEPRIPIECPKCNGVGLVECVAYIVDSDGFKIVAPEDYAMLPHTEDEARLWGSLLFQGDAEICPCCLGKGRVYEEDGEYIPIS